MTTPQEWSPPAYPVGPGWLGFFDDPQQPVVVHFIRDQGDCWRADAIYVATPALHSELLRGLSIPGYEALANTPQCQATLEETVKLAYGQAESLEIESVRAAARYTPPAKVRRSSVRLKVPPGAKPDSFYRKVAECYLRLAGESNRPAVELAEVNGVPVSTTHRWVKEARRRGHLPPGRKGRRG